MNTFFRATARSLLLGASLLGGAVAWAQPAPSVELDRLSGLAASQGQVRVILGLNLATRPEGLLTAQAKLTQRANIKAAQSAVVSQLLSGTGSQVHGRFESIPFLAATVDANGMARLRASGLVKDIQEDRLAKPSLLESTPLIHADTAWNTGTGYNGSGWNVAVLDTGVDKTHPFLSGKVVSEACYSSNVSSASDPAQSVCPGGVTESTAVGSGVNCPVSLASGCEHGTHVGGIVAGANGPSGSAGVAKGAGLIAVQVFSYFSGRNAVLSYSSDQIKGLERVLTLADTMPIASVNMSLGGGRYYGSCDSGNAAIKAAIDNLRSKGVATVIASGNDGYKDSISAPACVSTAVSVGATCDATGGTQCAAGINGVAAYSNIAHFVSLLAPGSYINSSVPGGGYGNWSGTSMATPHVAGAWAVLKQAQSDLSVTDGLAHLKADGIPVNDTRTGGTVTGMKRIDLSVLPNLSYVGLTVAPQGTGSGTVTSAPFGIQCGSNCSFNYVSGAVVTLTAQPSTGSLFAGWAGACSGTASTCTVTLSAAQSVTATFNKIRYDLTVSKAGTGAGTVSSSPAGISCGSNCVATFDAGTSVKLTATATSGRFTGWSGSCSGTKTTCTVSMSSAKTVRATFK